MIEPNITDQEKKCLRFLARLASEGKHSVRIPLEDFKKEGIEVDQQSLNALLRMMKRYGAIEEIQSTNPLESRGFSVSADAVQLVRELDDIEKKANDPGDIVEQIKDAARSNRVAAWALIIFVVLTALVTFANQGIQLLQNLGVIAKP